MARLTLSDGRWADLRPMLARDEMLLGEFASLEGSTDWKAYYKLKAKMTQALIDATRETSWDGGFGELPNEDIPSLFILWDNATEEEALPEASAPGSETPADAGR